GEPPVDRVVGAQVAAEQPGQARLERLEVHRPTSLWLPRGKLQARKSRFSHLLCVVFEAGKVRFAG
ncbi:MAG TPA: hypothetical protein VI751_10715, partial [Actinomycetota bacterium]